MCVCARACVHIRMCASQLISRYLTAVTARVFLSSKESKNKNATSQLEADYITAIGNLEYAAIPAYLERLIENDEAARAAAAHVDEGSASGLVVGGTGVRRNPHVNQVGAQPEP